jgi:two-component system, sensor histidine kinase LadS
MPLLLMQLGWVIAQTASEPLKSALLISLDSAKPSQIVDSMSRYWLDGSGKANAEQAHAQAERGAFQPRSLGQPHTIAQGALWIRLDLQTSGKAEPAWLLEVSLPTADDVQLHWQDKQGEAQGNAQGRWQMMASGDVVARSDWPVKGRIAAFVLPALGEGVHAVYLRVMHHQLPFSANVYLHTQAALDAQRPSEYVLLGLYFGLLSVVVVLSSLGGAWLPRSGLKTFTLFALSMGFLQMHLTGVAQHFLWPHSVALGSLSIPTVVVPAAISALIFFWVVIKPQQFSKPLASAMGVLLVVLAGVWLAEQWQPSAVTAYLSIALSGSMILLSYVAIWMSWTRGDRSARWIALGFLPIGLSVFPGVLRSFGWTSYSFSTQYGMILSTALSLPMFLFALFYRAALRREVQARLTGLPTHDALTSCANTRSLLHDLEGSLKRAIRGGSKYGLILVELRNHAWFAREHGSDVADRALLVLASHLQRNARDIDLVARIDSKQFALLLEGPLDKPALARFVSCISADTLKFSDHLPIGSKLDVRISAGLMPATGSLDLGEEAQVQLGWLISAAEAIPKDLRQRVHILGA